MAKLRYTPQRSLLNVFGQDEHMLRPMNVPLQDREEEEPQIAPEQTALLRLKETLGNVPSRQDYQPSTSRRILGGLAGGLTGAAYGPEAGVSAASSIVDKPYNRAYQDWMTQVGALQPAAELELSESELLAASQPSLSELAAYIRVMNEFNPDLRREIKAAEEAAVEPGRIAADQRDLSIQEYMESLRQSGQASLENLRSENLMSREEFLEDGRMQRSANDIAARIQIAREQINSRENISRLGRELRRELDRQPSQRVSVGEQRLAEMMASNEVATLLVNPRDIDQIFTTAEDSSGNEVYVLKPESDVNPLFKAVYDEAKQDIELLTEDLLSTAFDPIEGRTSTYQYDYLIEEVNE